MSWNEVEWLTAGPSDPVGPAGPVGPGRPSSPCRQRQKPEAEAEQCDALGCFQANSPADPAVRWARRRPVGPKHCGQAGWTYQNMTLQVSCTYRSSGVLDEVGRWLSFKSLRTGKTLQRISQDVRFFHLHMASNSDNQPMLFTGSPLGPCSPGSPGYPWFPLVPLHPSRPGWPGPPAGPGRPWTNTNQKKLKDSALQRLWDADRRRRLLPGLRPNPENPADRWGPEPTETDVHHVGLQECYLGFLLLQLERLFTHSISFYPMTSHRPLGSSAALLPWKSLSAREACRPPRPLRTKRTWETLQNIKLLEASTPDTTQWPITKQNVEHPKPGASSPGPGELPSSRF